MSLQPDRSAKMYSLGEREMYRILALFICIVLVFSSVGFRYRIFKQKGGETQ